MGWFSGGNVLEDILDPAGAISAFFWRRCC